MSVSRNEWCCWCGKLSGHHVNPHQWFCHWCGQWQETPEILAKKLRAGAAAVRRYGDALEKLARS